MRYSYHHSGSSLIPSVTVFENYIDNYPPQLPSTPKDLLPPNENLYAAGTSTLPMWSGSTPPSNSNSNIYAANTHDFIPALNFPNQEFGLNSLTSV